MEEGGPAGAGSGGNAAGGAAGAGAGAGASSSSSSSKRARKAQKKGAQEITQANVVATLKRYGGRLASEVGRGGGGSPQEKCFILVSEGRVFLRRGNAPRFPRNPTLYIYSHGAPVPLHPPPDPKSGCGCDQTCPER